MDDPTLIVIIGITGDLSQRKLLPALQEIMASGVVPKIFKIAGVSRKSVDLHTVVDRKHSSIIKHVTMIRNSLESTDDFKLLANEITELTNGWTDPQILFYLSIPPSNTKHVLSGLAAAKLNTSNIKLLLEKPFGYDLLSATELASTIGTYFSEKQVYRIDHYLAKEMAQNIITFRQSNPIFGDSWSSEYIESIEVIATEKIGIEGRAGFYEQTGALRDLVQSHLIQLASLVIMDVSDSDSLIEARLRAQRSLHIRKHNNMLAVVRGQYLGYKQEVGNLGSMVETFVRVELESHLDSWKGVPIIITSGKMLNEKKTEVIIRYKSRGVHESNSLTFRIAPHEGVELDMIARVPGYNSRVAKHVLDFTYAHNDNRLPEAYERVLVDAIRGDKFLFAGELESLTGWSIIQPILESWKSEEQIMIYPPLSSTKEIHM